MLTGEVKAFWHSGAATERNLDESGVGVGERVGVWVGVGVRAGIERQAVTNWIRVAITNTKNRVLGERW